MIQTQLDTDFINEIFSHTGKKGLDAFKKNRLEKAIKTLQQSDPVQCIYAQALFHLYFNNVNEAETLLTKSLEGYIDNPLLINGLIDVLHHKNDWQQLKLQMERLLNLPNYKIQERDILHYRRFSYINVDQSGQYSNIINKTMEQQNLSNSDFEDIQKLLSTLTEYGCGLDNYRQLVGLALVRLLQQYNNHDVVLKVRINEEEIQVVFSNQTWTNNEARELTEAINDAVLAVDDIDFQIETDVVSVFCINFCIEQLPEDFVYFSDDYDNDELVTLVHDRMQIHNKLTQIECEILDV